jgi:hypothetical protein
MPKTTRRKGQNVKCSSNELSLTKAKVTFTYGMGVTVAMRITVFWEMSAM